MRRKFRRRMRRNTAGMSAVAVADPDIAGINESEMILRYRRLAQQTGIRGVCDSAGSVRQEGKKEGKSEGRGEGGSPAWDLSKLHVSPRLKVL
jgi:hypothetical protein